LPFQFRETIEPAGGLDFSFEVDLWGRFRRNSEAARAEMLGTEYFARFVVMTLVSDLGAVYIRLRSLDEELGLVRLQRDELLAVIRLYKALGGGWQTAS